MGCSTSETGNFTEPWQTACNITVKRDNPDHQLNKVFHNLFCDSLKATSLIIRVRKTYKLSLTSMATENITF